MKPHTLADVVSADAARDLRDEDVLPVLRDVYEKGLSREEIRELTHAMIATGSTLNFDKVGKPLVDKHSTGGVGDKITLILTPLIASYGVAVPQIAGRGLGFTGGTIDKLESIPGWSAKLSQAQMTSQLETVGAFIARASSDLVPADKKLYALRDVSGMVDSIPLIASSIMSKKIASGARNLVLDVKWGRGAFMPTVEKARELAEVMVALGEDEGVHTRALVTNMNVPLGNAVGNSVEVQEAIDVLRGGGPNDVRELTVVLAREMLSMVNITDIDPSQNLDNGLAWEKFEQLIAAQGGDLQAHLPQAHHQLEIAAEHDGYVTDINARTVAEASWMLGAGRSTVGQQIDYSAGVVLRAKPGDFISKGEKLVSLYFSNKARINEAHDRIIRGFTMGERNGIVDFGPLVAAQITNKGFS